MTRSTRPEIATRLVELRAAFGRLVDNVPELSFVSADGDGNRNPDQPIVLRLAGAAGRQAVLTVGPHKADVTASSGDGDARAGGTIIHDVLAVRLTDGFAWNDAFRGTADELAYLLLKHMRRRLKAAGEHSPDLVNDAGRQPL